MSPPEPGALEGTAHILGRLRWCGHKVRSTNIDPQDQGPHLTVRSPIMIGLNISGSIAEHHAKRLKRGRQCENRILTSCPDLSGYKSAPNVGVVVIALIGLDPSNTDRRPPHPLSRLVDRPDVPHALKSKVIQFFLTRRTA